MKNTWAIVPVKPLNRSKSRLSSVLDIKQRETLSRETLERTLSILKQAEGIGGIVVISRDTAALAFVRQFDVQTLQESGTPELNASLTRATQVVGSWNAGAVLIIASDIPLLQVEDIDRMLSLTRLTPSVIIAPDRREEGTNALLIRPPGLIKYQFGEDSFKKHLEAGREAGAKVEVFQSLTLGLDVDIPADLDLYREMLVLKEMKTPAWLGSI